MPKEAPATVPGAPETLSAKLALSAKITECEHQIEKIAAAISERRTQMEQLTTQHAAFQGRLATLREMVGLVGSI